MGIRADGTVVMGRAPQVLFPPQARIHGQITWE